MEKAYRWHVWKLMFFFISPYVSSLIICLTAMKLKPLFLCMFDLFQPKRRRINILGWSRFVKLIMMKLQQHCLCCVPLNWIFSLYHFEWHLFDFSDDGELEIELNGKLVAVFIMCELEEHFIASEFVLHLSHLCVCVCVCNQIWTRFLDH